MTPALHILFALGTGAKHGYAIMQDAHAASGGRIRILPGTLYATIKTLLSEGLIEEVAAPKTADSADARRRYYRLTKAGRTHAEDSTQQMLALVRMGRAFLKAPSR